MLPKQERLITSIHEETQKKKKVCLLIKVHEE